MRVLVGLRVELGEGEFAGWARIELVGVRAGGRMMRGCE